MARENLTYKTLRFIAHGTLKPLFRLQIEGAEHVPKEGPVLIASNHLSTLDPVVLAYGLPRPVAFIAKAELFKMPFLSWLLPRIYAIPLARGAGDLSAIKAAIRALNQGLAFGIFPEGTRSRTGKLQPFKTGAAAIAARTGALVVPAAVIGSDKAWPVGGGPRPFKPVRVRFGQPLDFGRLPLKKAALEAATRELEAAVAGLLPPEYLPEDFRKELPQAQTSEGSG